MFLCALYILRAPVPCALLYLTQSPALCTLCALYCIMLPWILFSVHALCSIFCLRAFVILFTISLLALDKVQVDHFCLVRRLGEFTRSRNTDWGFDLTHYYKYSQNMPCYQRYNGILIHVQGHNPLKILYYFEHLHR